MSAGLLVVYGGSFDPLHLGHIKVIQLLQAQACISEIKVVPCYLSPHKSFSHTDSSHREAMLTAAIGDFQKVTIDRRELLQSRPSYTIETLKSLRREYPSRPIALALGWDSLQHFNRWRSWQDIFDYGHVLALKRPGFQGLENEQLIEVLRGKQTEVAELPKRLYGRFAVLEADMIDLSSTRVREALRKGQNIAELVAPEVAEYIQKHRLYPSV